MTQLKKAKRRKRRCRKNPYANVTRGISIVIDNAASSAPIIVNHGARSTCKCCVYIWDGLLPAGQSGTFNTNYHQGWVRINNKYFFHFTNPLLHPEGFAVVSVNGVEPHSEICCRLIPRGTLVGKGYMLVGETRTWNMEGQTFIATRLSDTYNFLRFSVKVPPTLPNGSESLE